MPDPVSGLVGGASLLSGVASARAQGKAAESAARAQNRAAQYGMLEQQRQFERVQQLLNPYMQGGAQAFEQQRVLSGAMGTQAQQDAISGLMASPIYTGMAQQGEAALMQNAAATGGLRGGNLQGALAQFRPQLLNQALERQYSMLGGLSNAGINAAGSLAGFGQGYADRMGQGFGTIGQAQAGSALAQGQARANMFNMIPQLAGMFAGSFGPKPLSTGTLTGQLDQIDTQYGIQTPQQYGSGNYNFNIGGTLPGFGG